MRIIIVRPILVERDIRGILSQLDFVPIQNQKPRTAAKTCKLCTVGFCCSHRLTSKTANCYTRSPVYRRYIQKDVDTTHNSKMMWLLMWFATTLQCDNNSRYLFRQNHSLNHCTYIFHQLSNLCFILFTTISISSRDISMYYEKIRFFREASVTFFVLQNFSQNLVMFK